MNNGERIQVARRDLYEAARLLEQSTHILGGCTTDTLPRVEYDRLRFRADRLARSARFMAKQLKRHAGGEG